MRDNHYEVYLQTSDPGWIVRIWEDNLYPEPGFELVAGEVDPFSACANTLTRSIMDHARRLVKAYGLRLREPGRMFLRRWR